MAFLFPILFSILLVIITIQQYMSWRRLSQFRGPFWASMTNLWMAKSIANRRSHLDLFEVSQKYGDLARIGPNTLLTSNPHLVRLMSSESGGFTRADWYAGQKFEVDHDNLFSTLDEKTHTERRGKMALGISGKDTGGLEFVMDTHILGLINLIKSKYISTASEFKPMDLARKIAFFTMDVTCDLTFGQPWGCLPKDQDVHQWFQSNEHILPNAIMFSTIPWMAKLFSIPVVGRLVMPKTTDATGSGRLLGIITDIVEKRFAIDEQEPEKKRLKRDMMASFIRMGITKRQAVSESSLQIVAGTDTTGTVIRATLLHIITNPHVYHAIQAEIDSVKIWRRPITSEAARKLPYLQAAIKEGSRMWPPATGLLSKRTPPHGAEINGTFIPGGVDIGQCAWGIQRSKTVYGSDSMLFRPERWLEAKGVTLKIMKKSLDLVWGSGKYSCLGKSIARMEMEKVMFELLIRFDFTIIDPTRPWKSECVGLWMQSEMWVKVTERGT